MTFVYNKLVLQSTDQHNYIWVILKLIQTSSKPLYHLTKSQGEKPCLSNSISSIFVCACLNFFK